VSGFWRKIGHESRKDGALQAGALSTWVPAERKSAMGTRWYASHGYGRRVPWPRKVGNQKVPSFRTDNQMTGRKLKLPALGNCVHCARTGPACRD